MSNIKIYQALWAMEQVPTATSPMTLPERVSWIKDNGFDGALNFIDDSSIEGLEMTDQLSQLVLEEGLYLGLSCNGFDLADIKGKVNYAKRVGARFINIMVKSYYIRGSEAIDLLDQVVNYGKEQEVLVHIETHRASITQDLIRTTDYVKALEDISLTIDLSHYIVAGEFTVENLGFYGDQLDQYFDILLSKMGAMHLRFSNGEQIQVPINRLDETHIEQYKKWWSKGLSNAIERCSNNEHIPVVIELGPEDYQQKILHFEQWLYDCDRLDETLKCKRFIEEIVSSIQ